MKQIFFLMSLFLSVTVVSCGSSDKENDLSIKIKNAHIALSKKDTVYQDIIIKSNTKNPVEIIKIVSTCGCTVVSDQFSKILNKYDSTTVSIKYTPSPIDSGHVKKEIVIYTNGHPKLYEVILKFDVK